MGKLAKSVYMEQVQTLTDLSLHPKHPLGHPHCLPMVLEPLFSSAQGRQSLPQKHCMSAGLQPHLLEGPQSYVTGSPATCRPEILAGYPGCTLDLTHYLTFSDDHLWMTDRACHCHHLTALRQGGCLARWFSHCSPCLLALLPSRNSQQWLLHKILSVGKSCVF